MNIQDYINKYENNELYTDYDMIIAETYIHLQNQIENAKAWTNKYPLNFSYLIAAAIYVLKLIENTPDLANTIHGVKILQCNQP